MQWRLSIIFFSAIFFLSSQVWAQLDSILIKNSSQAPQDEALVSGRYEVRPVEPLVEPTKKSTKRRAVRKVSSEVTPVSAKSVELMNSEAEKESPRVQVNPPSVVDQVSDLVLGKEQPVLQAYREQVHPDDIRLNRLEINVTPGFLYQESKSTYSYRNYLATSPFVSMGARIWLTPFIGVTGKYGTSMGADILESSSATTRIPVSHEVTEVGFDFRKFFGFSRRSNSLDLGIYYSEIKFSVPGDNSKRVKTKSGGLGLRFESRIPVAPSYAWILGAKVEPRVSQSEQSTGLSLQSGTSPQSSKVGVNLGGEIKMSREHQLIFDLGVSVEKTQFSGAASLSDPDTGLTPSGVSVTNTQALFSLGYRWGH